VIGFLIPDDKRIVMTLLISLYLFLLPGLALAQSEIIHRQILSMTFERPDSAEERMKEMNKRIGLYLSEIKNQKNLESTENQNALRGVGDCLQRLFNQSTIDAYLRGITECEQLVHRFQKVMTSRPKTEVSLLDKQMIFEELRYLLADSIEVTTQDWVVLDEVSSEKNAEGSEAESLLDNVTDILIKYQGENPSEDFITERLKLAKSFFLDDCEISQKTWNELIDSLKGLELVDSLGNVRPMIDLKLPSDIPPENVKTFVDGATTHTFIRIDSLSKTEWVLFSHEEGKLRDLKRVSAVPVLPEFSPISRGEYKVVEKNLSYYSKDEHGANVFQGSAGVAIDRRTYQLPFVGGIQGPQNRFILANIRYLTASDKIGFRSNTQIASNGVEVGAGLGTKNSDFISSAKVNPGNGETSISLKASHKNLSASYSDNLNGNRQASLQFNQRRWRAILISDLRSKVNVSMRYLLKRGEVSLQTDLKSSHTAGLILFLEKE
jgi:hypothetical protein